MSNVVGIGETAIDTFKELVWDALIKAALQRLFDKFAFLAWGPIGVVVEYFVLKYADELYAALKEYLVLELIAFKNTQLHAKYVTAAINLRTMAHTYGVNSNEFKEARDADKKALANFVLIAQCLCPRTTPRY